MAKIEKIKRGTATIYPATIPQAVVDPTDNKTLSTKLTEIDDSVSQLAGDVNMNCILSESFTLTNIVYDTDGIVSSADITLPNTTTGTIGNVITNDNGIESIDFTISGIIYRLSVAYDSAGMVLESNVTIL